MAERAGPRPRVHVHLDHGRGLERWRDRYERGEVWEPSPYSYADAADAVELSFSVDRPEGAVGTVVRKGLTKVLGFDVVHAWRNRAALRRAEVVWTHSEREHLAVLAVLRTVRAAERPRVIAQTIWLWDSWDGMAAPRRWALRRLLDGAAVHTTLSTVNAAAARRALPGAVVTSVPYGTMALPLQPPPDGAGGRSVRVVAPGNDRHRDWPTLLAAARAEPALEVRILARSALVGDVSAIPNVSVTPCRGRAEILAAYAWADVVAVPLVPNGHASGITVGLEALHVGRPLVITEGGGVADYFADAAAFPPAGDAAALARALTAAAADARRPGVLERRRSLVADRGLTAQDWVARHVLLTELALGRAGSLEDVAAFAPARTRA